MSSFANANLALVEKDATLKWICVKAILASTEVLAIPISISTPVPVPKVTLAKTAKKTSMIAKTILVTMEELVLISLTTSSVSVRHRSQEKLVKLNSIHARTVSVPIMLPAIQRLTTEITFVLVPLASLVVIAKTISTSVSTILAEMAPLATTPMAVTNANAEKVLRGVIV